MAEKQTKPMMETGERLKVQYRTRNINPSQPDFCHVAHPFYIGNSRLLRVCFTSSITDSGAFSSELTDEEQHIVDQCKKLSGFKYMHQTHPAATSVLDHCQPIHRAAFATFLTNRKTQFVWPET